MFSGNSSSRPQLMAKSMLTYRKVTYTHLTHEPRMVFESGKRWTCSIARLESVLSWFLDCHSAHIHWNEYSQQLGIVEHFFIVHRNHTSQKNMWQEKIIHETQSLVAAAEPHCGYPNHFDVYRMVETCSMGNLSAERLLDMDRTDSYVIIPNYLPSSNL